MFSLVASLAASPLVGAVDGYRYVLHSAMPAPEELKSDPAELRVVDQYVAQGPERTLIWSHEGEQTVERAQFARGERRFGLLVPFWDASRSASEEGGWSSYGRTVSYDSFDLALRRGEGDRTVGGEEATHYILEADFVSLTERDTARVHTSLTSDVWVLEDKPFTFAPFATAGIYGDPRLQVALAEELGELGMVVRVETRHTVQARDAEGEPLNDLREGAHLAWVTDLESAEVPEAGIPVASEETVDTLRSALRANADAACAEVLDGGTPEFVRELLNSEQQRGFMRYLEESCRRRAERQG